MKIFITGSNGQLGKELVKQLGDKNTIVTFNKSQLDISNYRQLERALLTEIPDIVINCAAYTNVDKCENDINNAYIINAIGPKNIAIISNKVKSKIVHISTDYVFDGKASIPYTEYDDTNPLNVYGRSKLYGERFIRLYNPNHFIIRTSWLYGDGRNFIKTILDRASNNKMLNVVDDQIGTPTSTVDLSRSIIDLIQTEEYGIYHGSCQGESSWYDFAKRIIEYKNINININRISSNKLDRPALRPKFSVLENSKLKKIGKDNFRHWEESLKEYIESERFNI